MQSAPAALGFLQPGCQGVHSAPGAAGWASRSRGLHVCQPADTADSRTGALAHGRHTQPPALGPATHPTTPRPVAPTLWCRRGMRVDVAHLPRLKARLGQRSPHGQLRADAVGRRLRDVVGIARQAVAAHLHHCRERALSWTHRAGRRAAMASHRYCCSSPGGPQPAQHTPGATAAPLPAGPATARPQHGCKALSAD